MALSSALAPQMYMYLNLTVRNEPLILGLLLHFAVPYVD